MTEVFDTWKRMDIEDSATASRLKYSLSNLKHFFKIQKNHMEINDIV